MGVSSLYFLATAAAVELVWAAVRDLAEPENSDEFEFTRTKLEAPGAAAAPAAADVLALGKLLRLVVVEAASLLAAWSNVFTSSLVFNDSGNGFELVSI